MIDGVTGGAWIEGNYRYQLTRDWKQLHGHGHGLRMLSVMLNPSTADGETNDPTLLRNIHFAQLWGYSGLLVVNPFALRSPHPSALLEAEDPIGKFNDSAIEDALDRTHLYLVAWGNVHKSLRPRVKHIEEWILHRARERHVEVVCLGHTMDGSPKHPLARGVHRVPNDQHQIEYTGRR